MEGEEQKNTSSVPAANARTTDPLHGIQKPADDSIVDEHEEDSDQEPAISLDKKEVAVQDEERKVTEFDDE